VTVFESYETETGALDSYKSVESAVEEEAEATQGVGR
jgi:hypothetical protein